MTITFGDAVIEWRGPVKVVVQRAEGVKLGDRVTVTLNVG